MNDQNGLKTREVFCSERCVKLNRYTRKGVLFSFLVSFLHFYYIRLYDNVLDLQLKSMFCVMPVLQKHELKTDTICRAPLKKIDSLCNISEFSSLKCKLTTTEVKDSPFLKSSLCK